MGGVRKREEDVLSLLLRAKGWSVSKLSDGGLARRVVVVAVRAGSVRGDGGGGVDEGMCEDGGEDMALSAMEVIMIAERIMMLW